MVITARQREIRNIDALYATYLRAISLFLIVFAIQYWMRLTGIFEGAEFRFDTMSAHWRFAAALLAALLPVSALGLWGAYNWGLVLWIIAAICEIAMYTWFWNQFGTDWLRVLFHVAGILGLAAFRASMWKMANKR